MSFLSVLPLWKVEYLDKIFRARLDDGFPENRYAVRTQKVCELEDLVDFGLVFVGPIVPGVVPKYQLVVGLRAACVLYGFGPVETEARLVVGRDRIRGCYGTPFLRSVQEVLR